MSSAAETELVALFITYKEILLMRQTLIDMGWPQPPSPIQTDNSTVTGVVNKNITTKKSSIWTCDCIGYAVVNPHNNYVFTGPLVTTIGLTIAPSTTSQFSMNQSTPYLRAPIRGYTNPF